MVVPLSFHNLNYLTYPILSTILWASWNDKTSFYFLPSNTLTRCIAALLWVVHTNNWEGRHSGILLRWDRPTAQAGTGKEEGKRCDWKELNLEIFADFILVIVEQLLALLENFLDLRNGSGAVDQLGHVVGVRPHVGHDQGKQGNRFAGACSCEKKTMIQPT